jgi:P2 family phage contractile tail tube protein
MATLPRILRGLDLDVDGIGYGGRIREFTPPPITIKTDDYTAGGLDGTVKLDMGMEALDASMQFGEIDPAIVGAGSLSNGPATNYILRGALKKEGENAQPLRMVMRGSWTGIDWGTFTPGTISNLTVNFHCRYFKLAINGVTVHEIDVEGMIRIINGRDELEDIRNAMGV